MTTKPDGSLSTNTVQVPDPRLVTGLATAQAVNTASAPVSPWYPLISLALGVATAASTLVAASKNKDLKAQTSAADSLAEAIVSLGNSAVDHAGKVAAANGTVSVVAEHIDNNTTISPTKTS